MKTMQFVDARGLRLAVAEEDEGQVRDVTSLLPSNGSLVDLIGFSRAMGTDLPGVLGRLYDQSTEQVTADLAHGWVESPGRRLGAGLPVQATEVWAAGVSYRRSREARREESGAGEGIYRRVYDAERPELFLKDSHGMRSVPTGVPIGVRADSVWTVPEPEIALVLDADGTIVGVTLANDVTARDIEAENPLYLPQAKIFSASCAYGPSMLVVEGGVDGIPDMEIHLEIADSDGATRFEAETSTQMMHRSYGELVDWLRRYNVFRDGTVLLTGTGIVPPGTLALTQGDQVTISTPSIGRLVNTVEILSVCTTTAAQVTQ